MNQRITAVLVPESRRLSIAATLFGHRFPLQLEPAIYQFAGFLSDPVGRSNSPTFGHFKIPHHEGRVTER